MSHKVLGGLLGALAHSRDHGHFGGGGHGPDGGDIFPASVPSPLSGHAAPFAASLPGLPAGFMELPSERFMEQMPGMPKLPSEPFMEQMPGMQELSSEPLMEQMPVMISEPHMEDMPVMVSEPFMQNMPGIPLEGHMEHMPRDAAFFGPPPSAPMNEHVRGALLKAKCRMLEEAERKGGPKLMLLKTMGWFGAMQRKCAAMAEYAVPSAPPEMPHMQQHSDGAWNWQALAGGLRQILGDGSAKPQEAPDMQHIMMAQMSEAVMHQKCRWLEQQVKQLAMGEHHSGVYGEDEGTDKLRKVAFWAQNQPWFGMLRTKCDELAAAAAQTAIHV